MIPPSKRTVLSQSAVELFDRLFCAIAATADNVDRSISVEHAFDLFSIERVEWRELRARDVGGFKLSRRANIDDLRSRGVAGKRFGKRLWIDCGGVHDENVSSRLKMACEEITIW